MAVNLRQLTIGPKSFYSDPGPNNPYKAKISVGFTDNDRVFETNLSSEILEKLMRLISEVVLAATKQELEAFQRDVFLTTVVDAKAIENASS